MKDRHPGKSADALTLVDISRAKEYFGQLLPEFSGVLDAAMAIAGAEFRHRYIGTHHVTFALIRTDPQIAGSFAARGITEASFASAIRTNLGQGQRPVTAIGSMTSGLFEALESTQDQSEYPAGKTPHDHLLEIILGQPRNDTLPLIVLITKASTNENPPDATPTHAPRSLSEIKAAAASRTA